MGSFARTVRTGHGGMRVVGNAKPTMETYIEMSPLVFEENLARADALVGDLVERCGRVGLRAVHFVASGSSHNSCVAARSFAERVLGVRVDVFTPSRYLDELERLDVTVPDAFVTCIKISDTEARGIRRP